MKRPWNRIPLPVYSLVTQDAEHGFNMNIMTYVSVVSMKPKVFMIALDPRTKSFDNFASSKHGVLQMLSQDQSNKVRTLGKRSAHQTKKINTQTLPQFHGFPYLPEANALVEIKAFEKIQKSSMDHVLFLCDMVSSKNLQDDAFLTTLDLIEQGVIL